VTNCQPYPPPLQSDSQSAIGLIIYSLAFAPRSSSIYGQDLDTLRQLAETTRQRLSPISGLVDLQVEKQVLIPQVRIQVDHERAALSVVR
jgi:hypothetical protein